MADEEPKAPGGGAGNRTIQIDALTDVQLVDQVAGDDESEGQEAGLGGVSAPPPLPRRQQEQGGPPRSNGRTYALTLVAVVAGGGLAYLAVHYLLPSAAPQPSTASYSAATTAAPPPTSAVADPAPASEVRRVDLDEEMVIRAADPGE